jgi:hypothetical protein
MLVQSAPGMSRTGAVRRCTDKTIFPRHFAHRASIFPTIRKREKMDGMVGKACGTAILAAEAGRAGPRTSSRTELACV